MSTERNTYYVTYGPTDNISEAMMFCLQEMRGRAQSDWPMGNPQPVSVCHTITPAPQQREGTRKWVDRITGAPGTPQWDMGSVIVTMSAVYECASDDPFAGFDADTFGDRS
ncbi:hypothetical protein [Williamsia sterculiae]|uniref:Uncharacterized protein n=1 Tax=Williamsia sterculiae TaxID=1344003 RepID=A0A1N7HEE6_9NOCA|nr:hypothetical protein [Williamsia sterculiae]SIS23247.1 hypothetical protein SAMN05445060_4082 [Williamsia sterculiae]